MLLQVSWDHGRPSADLQVHGSIFKLANVEEGGCFIHRFVQKKLILAKERNLGQIALEIDSRISTPPVQTKSARSWGFGAYVPESVKSRLVVPRLLFVISIALLNGFDVKSSNYGLFFLVIRTLHK